MSKSGFYFAIKLMGLGWYVALSIILGLLGGWWMDNLLQSTPLLTLVGVITGTALAFYGVYKMIKPLVNMDNDSRQE